MPKQNEITPKKTPVSIKKTTSRPRARKIAPAADILRKASIIKSLPPTPIPERIPTPAFEGTVAKYAFVTKFSEFERGKAKIMRLIRSIWRVIFAKPQPNSGNCSRNDIRQQSPEPEKTAWNPAYTKSAQSKSALAWFLAVAIFLFPFVVLPWKNSTQEFTKQLYLTIVVGAILFLAALNVFKGRGAFLLPRHVVTVAGILIFFTALASAFLSGLLPYGLFGYGGVESLSVFGILLLGLWALFIFKTGQNYFTLILKTLILSGSIVSLTTLLSLFGVNLYTLTSGAGFNPAGTVTSLAVVAAATIILAVGVATASSSKREQIVYGLAAVPPVLLILGTGLRSAALVLAVGLGMLFSINVLSKQSSKLKKLGLGSALILAILFTVVPVGSLLKMPAQLSLSHQETWSILGQTLKENPILGVGPASFGAAYLRFRSPAISQTPFWNVTFDWGSSTGLTWLVTLGILGTGLLILGFVTVLWSATRTLRNDPSKSQLAGLIASGAALFVALWLFPLPFVSGFFISTLFALLMVQTVRPWKGSHETVAEKTSLLLRTCKGAFFAVAILALLIVQAQRVRAQMLLEKALSTTNADRAAIENLIVRAVNLDPYSDSAWRLLAEIRRATVQEHLSALAQTGDNNDFNLTVLKDDAQRALLPALEALKRAPKNVANLITLGSVYLDLAPLTKGAGENAIETFERAHELSPNDPAILVNLAIARLVDAKRDGKDSKETLIQSAKELLLEATRIRPNFTFAYLELARLLARQGSLDEALKVYNQVQLLTGENPNLNYEIGLQLLQNGRVDEAQTYFEEAIRLAPNFSNARWFLAQIFEQKNNLYSAITQLERIIELNPENEAAKTRLQELTQKLASETE